MAMEDVPYVSVSVLFYFQSLFIVVKVCDIFAPMMLCCEVCVSLFDWTQPTCTRYCESGACEPKSPLRLVLFFVVNTFESVLKITTISLDGVREGQLWCIRSSLSFQAWIM